MATRKIIKVGAVGEEILLKKSKKVERFDENLCQLIDDMFETTRRTKTGVGLSAVQIGVLKRVFVIQTNKENFEFVNPEILLSSPKTKLVYEACLSVPKKFGKVRRPVSVKVCAQNRRGEFFEKEFKGFEAQAIFHEMDHLDGKLFTSQVEGEIKDM